MGDQGGVDPGQSYERYGSGRCSLSCHILDLTELRWIMTCRGRLFLQSIAQGRCPVDHALPLGDQDGLYFIEPRWVESSAD